LVENNEGIITVDEKLEFYFVSFFAVTGYDEEFNTIAHEGTPRLFRLYTSKYTK
jgi:hypothetical protein